MAQYSCSMLLLFFTLFLSSNQISSADLIKQTCKTTKYYDLCVSSLRSDSTSSKADTKGLALILARVAMANATATTSYLSSQMLSAVANGTTPAKSAMKECADKYAFASEALKGSVQDLSNELYDYAYMQVMAAADYSNACRNAFKRSPGLIYPPEIARREDGFKRICDVVLGIIDALVV